jgi:MSHA biogenesis protein MshI
VSTPNDFGAKQSVNLYTAELRPKKELLQAGTAVLALMALVLVMVGIAGVTQWQSQQARAEQSKMSARVEALNAGVASLTQTIEARQARPQQRDELERVAGEVGQRRRILADIEVLAAEKSRGFSSYLEALARQTLNGLWLTGIHLAESGAYVALEGQARAGERVPAYLERLSQESVFKGSAFESFTLDRPEDSNVLSFHMATAVKAGEAADEF